MKKASLIIILIIAIVITSDIYKSAGRCAENEPDDASGLIVGTVDMAALYALHPLTQYYDKNLNLFARPIQSVNRDEIAFAIAKREKEFTAAKDAGNSELKRLKDEISQIESELQKIDFKKDFEIASLNKSLSESARLDSEKAVQERQNRLKKDSAALEEKFAGEGKELNLKLKHARAAYGKALFSLLKIYYLTPDESAETVDKINGEIREAINFIAAKKGIRSVINVTRKAPAEKADGANAGEKNSIDFNSIHKPDYTKIIGLLQMGEEDSNDPNYVKIRRSEGLKKFGEIYTDRAKALEIMGEHAIDSPVLVGGADITSAAALYIYSKYGIPRETAERAASVIAK